MGTLEVNKSKFHEEYDPIPNNICTIRILIFTLKTTQEIKYVSIKKYEIVKMYTLILLNIYT